MAYVATNLAWDRPGRSGSFSFMIPFDLETIQGVSVQATDPLGASSIYVDSAFDLHRAWHCGLF